MNKRIGILTWHYYENFGSALQAYALQEYLVGAGFKVSIINYRNPKFGPIKEKKDRFRALLHNTVGKTPGRIGARFQYGFINFRIRFLHETYAISSFERLGELVKKYGFSTIIYGSDQIWAPNVFNPIYMGKGLNDNKLTKISYAASIGLRNIPSELGIAYHEYLSDFHRVSVREEEGKQLLDKLGISKVDVVLDPTLLLSSNNYTKIEVKPRSFKNVSFVFCYFLNSGSVYKNQIIEYSLANNCCIIGISADLADYDWMSNAGKIGPAEFLFYVNHSQTVFTDSYHGAVFSLLFHKKLYLFRRFSENDPINQNSRIEQLQNWFSIKTCQVKSDNVDLQLCISDYSEFEKKLDDARLISIRYLRDSLADA